MVHNKNDEEVKGYEVMVKPIFGAPQMPKFQLDIFVLMPFEPKLKPVYHVSIVNVAQKLNLKIKRADNFFKIGTVMSDIWSGIYHSRIIIADCTNRNANVFYEIGIAHTLGKKVITIAQDPEDIPFDIKQYRYIKYTLTQEGMQNFEKELTETLKNELEIKEKTMSVFISYSEEDMKNIEIIPIVNALHKIPEIKDIQTKLPQIFKNENIKSHNSFPFSKGKTIIQWIEWSKKATQAADVFIIICSEASIKSEKAKIERYIADKYKKLIIPLYEDRKYKDEIYGSRKLRAINIKDINIEQFIQEISEIIKMT